MVTARLLIGVLPMVLVFGCDTGRGRGIRSFALVPPEGGEPAFEPHVSTDPDDPSRLIVAAHYGIGYNRGGQKIWAWQSIDGGVTWEGTQIPNPDTGGLAADAVTGFATDGSVYVSWVFADTTDFQFTGGAALARATTEVSFQETQMVARGGFSSAAGAVVDKEWFAIDTGSQSHHRGNIYVTWHYNRAGNTPGSVHSSVWFRASRDGGQTFDEPRHIADGFRGQVVVTPSGAIHIAFTHVERAIFYRVMSVNGGRTFSQPEPVVDLGDSVTVDMSHLMALRGGGLLLCWSQTDTADSTRYTSRCTRSLDGRRWDPPHDVMPDLSPGHSFGFPTTTSAGESVWLLGYLSGPDSTSVLLLRSVDDGMTFRRAYVLAQRAIGQDRLCIAAGSPCRRNEDAFFPGDYFGLATTRDAVLAAYVLPDGNFPSDRATVYLSIVSR